MVVKAANKTIYKQNRTEEKHIQFLQKEKYVRNVQLLQKQSTVHLLSLNIDKVEKPSL